MPIKKADVCSTFQIAHMKLIEKQLYRSGLIAPSILPIKKVHSYSTFQVAQLLLIKEQKVSEWAIA